MRKLFLILAFMLCGIGVTVTAQNMRSLFMGAPDELFPLLTKGNRADCVDYIEAGMVAGVSNRLGGMCRMKVLSSDYMLLEPSNVSLVQAKMLPSGGDTLICVVKSVKAEAAASRVEFYDKDWCRLDADAFYEAPAIVEFFVSPDSAARYVDKCDIYLVKLSLSPESNTLVAEFTMPDYMNEDDAALIRPLMRKVVYRWNGNKFIRE